MLCRISCETLDRFTTLAKAFSFAPHRFPPRFELDDGSHLYPSMGSCSKQRRDTRLGLKPCHVLFAEKGEAMHFDRGGQGIVDTMAWPIGFSEGPPAPSPLAILGVRSIGTFQSPLTVGPRFDIFPTYRRSTTDATASCLSSPVNLFLTPCLAKSASKAFEARGVFRAECN